jgi:hypothetical protein
MDPIERATSELAQIERDVERLIARRDQLRQFVALSRSLFGDAEASKAAVEARQESIIYDESEPATMKEKVRRAAWQILRAEGPMQTKPLVEKLVQRGLEITGADPVMTVSVIMSRSRDRFISDRSRGGWVPKE